MTQSAASDGPPRRTPRVRAALGGVVVLALLGVGAAVVGSVVTPGGQTLTIDASGTDTDTDTDTDTGDDAGP
ncbi:hypothetical protein, partial [Microcella sp.]|uniref:hypothetical protein n=1 Tax=Microcella sp. TaxID=1913979 RepID=UPI003F70BCC2